MIGTSNPRSSEGDANVYHAVYSHADERLLKATMSTLEVALTGISRTCGGRANKEGLRHPIPSNTECRSAKELDLVFVETSEPKEVDALGKKRYVAFFRDDFSRSMLTYFLIERDFSE